MAELIKAACPRCNGTGNYSFNLIHGTRCFQCGGKRFVMVDPVKTARNKAAREKRAATRKAEMEARAAHHNHLADEREKTYREDSRIGPQTKARCEAFPAVAYEIYKMLHDYDRGHMDNGRQVHPSCVERIAV